jgi:antitoxin (DNA-binding transcriptional repressor) of toxin-antitoxin stability system
MQVSLVEAAASLSDLVRAAIDGEEIILLDGDRPAIRFVPIESVKQDRQPGSAKGLNSHYFTISSSRSGRSTINCSGDRGECRTY